jgi:predicted nucleic acid-binding protein
MPRFAAILNTTPLVDTTVWRVVVQVGVGADLYRAIAARRSIESAVEVGCRAKRRGGDDLDDITAYRERETRARLDAFEGNVVEEVDYATLESALRHQFDDPDDAYVAAAALVSGAEVIITHNVRDFTAIPPHLEALTPDQFLTEQFSHRPDAAVQTLRDLAAAVDVTRQPPPVALEDLLTRLDHPARMPTLAVEIRNWITG